ncbi:Ig-like domain-containing protein [Bradyrhizobium xenonodulans]|uniref:Ig-like domain-containing protein n=1 Tax=Bradyrhizobium xenonodulans TaxID=2736875 RepID=A0ABY7MPS2_9BRAD|nr:Ig-like domain-containing protein [Bradyrhizobium xenonodulans]WBL80344.1 Ig-like domain-containing protein [Bradyrhizobium xenonodulans]
MTTAISNVTAIDASKLVQSVGVNTHLGNWTVYENICLVESSLAYLGVDTVRDGSMFSTAHAQAAYSQLATDGIKFDFFTPPGTNLSTFIKQLDAFVVAHPSGLFAIEGPNEVDIQAFTYNGSSSLSSAAAFQQALYAAVQADAKIANVPVYNLTLSQPNGANYSQVGNLSSSADYANIHAYVWSGTTPNQVLLNDIKIAQSDAAGLPVIFTETGYDTMTSDSMSGVDQTVQAKYTLDTLMDAFKAGVAQTFLYELFDEASDPNYTNKEAHFGLFNNDGSPKLVATAIHNLTTILSDPNASQPFTPGSLAYSLDNMPSSANQLLLQQHNGAFDLVLWDEHVIWDPTKQKEVASPTSDVMLNLGKSYGVVYVYDPLVGTSPIATYTNVSQIHVSLTDHPLVIQIGAGSAESGSSSSAGAITDTTAPAAPSIATFSPDSNVAGDGITKANQLTLAGTAEAGSKVLVFDGATQVGTATVDASGNWSFATGTLVDGTHVFTGQAVDAAGNVSATSGALSVAVDTVAPNAPKIVSDTIGSSSTIGVAGTAEAGSTIKLYEGSSLLGTAVTASNGVWSITTGSLAQGAHVFTATATDAAGNSSGLSAAFDPLVGTLIEAAGTTSLISAGNNFYLSNAGTDVLLKFGGTAYVAGQFSGWAPIGAEATSTGFEVAWKNSMTGLYTVWNTDSNGNFTSNLLSKVSGTSASFESIETLFNQDLNRDGVIGIPNKTIEAVGSTSLVQLGGNFLLNPIAGGAGPTLKYGGVAYVAGQFSGWVPLGAEATSSGYDVAWKNTSTGLYTVWTTDSNGNFASNLLSNVSGTNASLASVETVFQQDLNGDGVIGLHTTTIEASGATSLLQVGSNYFLGGSGPTLKYGGVAYVAGQFSGWVPLGAEATSNGYDVAWKNTSTGLYTVWTTDSNGNFTSNLFSNVSATSASLKSVETVFHQDLNGDGPINTSSTVLDISGKIALTLPNMSQPVMLEPGAVLELAGAASGSVTFKGITGILILDHSTQFTGTISGLSGNGDPSASDILDLKDISFGAGTKASYAGNASGGVLSVSDAQNHVAHLTLVGDYTHSTFNLSSDANGGTLVIDPPADGFNFSAATSQPGSTSAAIPLGDGPVPHSQVLAPILHDLIVDSNVQHGMESAHFVLSHASPADLFLLHA